MNAAGVAPGVEAVLTGADVAADGLGGMPVGWGVTQPDGSAMVEPPWPSSPTSGSGSWVS